MTDHTDMNAAGPPERDLRLDLVRGIGQWMVFLDHIPYDVVGWLTIRNYGFSDAADLFVFLAGWSLRLMAEGRGEPRPIRDVMLRLFGRALELYAAQAMITMLAIALLAVSATELDNPLLLQWHNAAAVFTDPVPTHIGLAVLTHQLGYFDILPLYVVLMLMAPFFSSNACNHTRLGILIAISSSSFTGPVFLAFRSSMTSSFCSNSRFFFLNSSTCTIFCSTL